MSSLFAQVAAVLKRAFPAQRELHLGVAVSGGPDSVALLGVLVELLPRRGGRLTVLHVNHGVRPESAHEQQLVEDWSRRWQLPCHVVRLSPPRSAHGIEAWAREERYRFFAQAKETHGLDAVAVAHTADDQAETVLFRLLRGAGHRGLAGMPVLRDGWILRPLLNCSRAEVMAYLAKKQLPYVTDASNADLRFSRNKIRHELLPLLEREYSPQTRRRLVQMAEALRPEEEWLEAQAGAAYERVRAPNGRLALLPLLLEPAALRHRIFRLWWQKSGATEELSFPHLKNLEALSERRMSGVVELPGAWVARREGDCLFLATKAELRSEACPSSYWYLLSPDSVVLIPETGWIVNVSSISPWDTCPHDARVADAWQAIVAVDTLIAPLIVRNIRRGDRMRPLGMPGQKKIHDILSDKKIAPRQRRLWPVVVCGEEILWVPGCVRGESAKVTSVTQRVLRLTAQPIAGEAKTMVG
jgi:tRNA(Ile)-lysidine synthase